MLEVFAEVNASGLATHGLPPDGPIYVLPVSDSDSIYAPHPNVSAYLINKWYWTTSPNKSVRDLQGLIKNVLNHPEFNANDLRDVNFTTINRVLLQRASEARATSGGNWVEVKIPLVIPLGHLGKQVPETAEFIVDDFYHRPLVGVVRSIFANSLYFSNFVLEPYELRYQPPTGGPELGVYGEMYCSKYWRDAHAEIQRLPRKSDDTYPRIIAMAMLHSDGMLLGNFGGQSAWPVYLQFGNESKYRRHRVKATNVFQIAHLPHVRATCTKLAPFLIINSSVARHGTILHKKIHQKIWVTSFAYSPPKGAFPCLL